MSKHPLIVKLLDDVSSQAFGIKRTDALKVNSAPSVRSPQKASRMLFLGRSILSLVCVSHAKMTSSSR